MSSNGNSPVAGSAPAGPELDPVTFEVLKNSLITIVDQGAKA